MPFHYFQLFQGLSGFSLKAFSARGEIWRDLGVTSGGCRRAASMQSEAPWDGACGASCRLDNKKGQQDDAVKQYECAEYCHLGLLVQTSRCHFNG